jgi:hypothetical protein
MVCLPPFQWRGAYAKEIHSLRLCAAHGCVTHGVRMYSFDGKEHGLVLHMRGGGIASIPSLGYVGDTAVLAGPSVSWGVVKLMASVLRLLL